MPSLEELSAWSEEEIANAIRVRLPEGQALSITQHPGYFVVLVEADTVVILEEAGPDQRLLLLNIFGSLFQTSSVSPDSTWCRKREFSKLAIDGMFHDSSTPDPGDLDPIEIANLYKK